MSNRWLGKKDVVHINNELLLGHKIKRNNAICSNIDVPRDYHTKWSKSDRGRQIYDTAYIQNLKKKWYRWMYLQNGNRLIDLENKFMVSKGERW